MLRSAARAVLQPLVRVLLRNGLPYGEFAEIARRVYVEVAHKDFTLPGRKQSVSRISTLTGLTRKEVTRIQAGGNQHDAENAERHHRPARVIGSWVREKRYLDARGRPRDLPMDGGPASFSELVRESSGDIPPRAMADELVRVGAVEALPNGILRLLTRAYVPRGDQAAKMAILGADVRDLIRTIDHNLTGRPEEAYFQRRVSYDNLPVERLAELKKTLARKSQATLESLDRVLAHADRDRNPSVRGTGRVRAGIGIYYFEEHI